VTARRIDAEVDHILEAVGERFVPPGLSGRRLRKDIDWAGTHYHVRAEGSDARWRERCERLRDVEKLARKLRKKLSDETGEWVRHRISGSFPLGEGAPRAAGYRSRDPAPSLHALRHGLARLARVAVREVTKVETLLLDGSKSIGPTGPNRPWPNERSAFNWLVEWLAEIYSRHFGRDAGSSRETDGPDVNGPYIRFVEAVLADLDILNRRGGKPKPYSRAYIARELGATAARKLEK
jgi:hypothetical protein